VVTDHRVVDYQLVMDHAPLIVDSRNVTAGLVKTKARVVSLSAGQAPIPS
jgi:UDP-N-acetyl-D-glucosamine dehydrogenase